MKESKKFCLIIFIIMALSALSQLSYADIFHCPALESGTYPDKFQTPGDNSSFWTLDAEGSHFVTITSGITWTNLMVDRAAGTPKLICEGQVNGSTQMIKVFYPLYFASYWTCLANPEGDYFTCELH